MIDDEAAHDFGPSHEAPSVTVSVHDPGAYRAILLGGTIGAAEAYMDGLWSCDDLKALVQLFAVSHDAHYGLGNDFYRLFLDETLSYSCGIFDDEKTSMREASEAKLERICGKLELSPSDHLPEIGTGWGGLAIHAARHYGCRVTTTTISRAQYELSRERIREAGLSQRVEVLMKDYRDLGGVYDKLVSIEMIEAVGDRHFDTFFAKCAELLHPQGKMVLQTITNVFARAHCCACLKALSS